MKSARSRSAGQVLVMFVLFLLVLLGVSALAIDYASWLLTDRALQNVSDHAALAGASQFEQREIQGNCSGGAGPKCVTARAQAWASISNELGLALSDTMITCLATEGPDGGDSPAAGETNTARATAGACSSEADKEFGHTIWVTTPPPAYAAYTDVGGRYPGSFGIMFVRVDREVRSFFAGVIGIQPDPRAGWATAGALPTDFALEIFCRNSSPLQSGVCENSAGLTIDGQGGIRLVRGDIGSNESLKVSSNTGGGVIVESGNVFLVNGSCAPSTWNCPNSPPQGGISDGVTGKNAFYIPPIAVPHFESPLDLAFRTAGDCAGASLAEPCVPYRDEDNANPGSPGDWECDLTGTSHPLCGRPCAYYPVYPTCTDPATLNLGDPGYGAIRCDARLPGVPDNHLDPITGGTDLGNVLGDPNQNNGNEYNNVDDDYTVPDPDTNVTPGSPPSDWIYVNDLNHPNNPPISTITTAFTMNLNQPFGTPTSGLPTTVRYVAFKTENNGDVMSVDTGYPVTLTVSLLKAGVSVASDTRTLLITPTRYEFTVGAGVLDAAAGDYNSLSLRFSFESANQANNNALERGGGVSWAEAETPALLPNTSLPAMISPGYYHSITIPDDGCAILDPTAVHGDDTDGLPEWELEAFQVPGVYRFGGGSNAEINLGNGAFLIGDGVTLLFDEDFPDPTGGRGIVLAPDSVLAINTAVVELPAGSTPCTPYEEVNPHDATDPVYNPSSPLPPLPFSSLCAAWGIDPESSATIRPGARAWPICEDTSLPQCVDRGAYNPTTGYRGVTFYFTPNWGSPSIEGRFQMPGGSSDQPGIAFRGILYAPYDDVKISGGNGFTTIGQVLSWTAKFNGGSAFIELDYPYDYVDAKPYLLEPTVDHN